MSSDTSRRLHMQPRQGLFDVSAPADSWQAFAGSSYRLTNDGQLVTAVENHGAAGFRQPDPCDSDSQLAQLLAQEPDDQQQEFE